MALQLLYGSEASQYGSAGYKTLAATPEIFNYITEQDTSSSRIYDFDAEGEHPIKFCSYYNPYINAFVQTATSYEQDYVGRDSHISHTLVLSPEETAEILKPNNTVLNPDMFMNGRSAEFSRPDNKDLPSIDYTVLERYNAKFGVTEEDFKRLIFAVLQLPIGYSNIFIMLAGTPAENSYIAVNLMNLLYAIMPAEYQKRIGFSTYATNFDIYENFNVYFVTKNVNLFDIPHDSFVFDLTSNDPEHQRYYGIDEERYQRCLDIIRTFNLNGDKEFVKYLNAILPKLDSASAFSEDTLEEIYHLYCFTNINDINKIEIGNLLNQVLVESIFKYYFIVDDADKPTFEDSINKYFQKLLFLVNLGKYCSSDISGIINVLKTCENYYPHISTTLRLVLCQSWTNVISHFVSLKEYDSSTDVFLDYIFDDSHEKSQLISDILDDCLVFYIRYRSENADIGKLTEVAIENKLSKILIYQRYLKNTLTAENFDVFDKEALYSYIFFVRDIMIRAQDEKIKATLGDNCMTAIIQFIKKDVIADLYGRSIVNLMEAADTVELIDAVSLLYNEFRKAIPDYSSVLLTYLLSARCHKAETLLQLLNYKLSAAGINDFDRFVEEDHINTLRLVVNDITKLIDGKITSKYLDMVFAYSDIAEKCQESAPTYSIIDYQKKLDTNCVNKIKTWVRTLITNVKPSMTGCLFVNTDTKEILILLNQENKTKTLTGDLSVFSQPVSEFLCDNRSKTVTQYDKKYVFNCRGALDDYYNSLKISNESDLTAKMMEFMLSIDEFSKNCGGSFPDDYKDDMAEFINSVLFDEQSDKKQAKENEKIINHNDFFKSLLKEYSAKQNSGKSKFGFPFGKNK